MNNTTSVISSRKVFNWFGNNKVLFDISAEIVPGTVTSIVGPSGCGKSVWLKGVAGIIPPKQGNIFVHVGDGDVYDIRKPCRHVGMVAQDKTIFPFWNAIDNVAAGLMLDQTSISYRVLCYPSWRKLRKKHLEEAAFWLEKVGLKGSEYKFPGELSGGMQQRVAIAQAMINKPRVLLMDEPFSALDEATKERQQRLLLTLRAENEAFKAKGEEPPYTFMIVTHEINEAIYVGDRVIGLSQFWDWKAEGHETCPGARIVYDKPAPVFNPYDVPNYGNFVEQKTEILKIVFNKENVREKWQSKIESARIHEGVI